LIETIHAGHKHTESVLSLLRSVCTKLSLTDVETECQQLASVLRDTDSMFATLKDASTADLSQMLNDVKKYASDVVAAESREVAESSRKQADGIGADINDRFKKLESRVLSELATGGSGEGDEPARPRAGRAADSQLLKKVANRMSDFESQVSSQLQVMQQDFEKKVQFLGSQPRGAEAGRPDVSLDNLTHDIDALKYDVGELKDLLNGAKGDTAHVKRIVLACERDMEDFTAAMDAVNVDLDEMRAKVDSTHSIITSRQRVEATVTAEISTMRLDMGDMQEALKAHDAWMEDVSQSLQEAHERCHQLAQDIADLSDQTQAKLDAKTDVTDWNDMNDDIDSSIKTVRDMASALRLEVDSRRRRVDETFNVVHSTLSQHQANLEQQGRDIRNAVADSHKIIHARIDRSEERAAGFDELFNMHHATHRDLEGKIVNAQSYLDTRLDKAESDLRREHQDVHKEAHDRMDGIDRHHANIAKETSKRLNALDLRISGLQGSSGEQKRDLSKLRDEVNNLTVKSAAHDVDIGKNCDDIKKLERQRAEDNQRHKQDMDAVYEELDQKVYEKNFQALEDNVTKLTRGTVKLCQVIGVFPGARMNDGTEAELDIDVELLNWQDCCQNLTGRVEKTWRQHSSQKFKSILDLVSKKADHSVLRLLQISQQHIESQLDRVRHERELWKEVVDKRAQQPLQLALTLKDPHTGAPLQPGFPPLPSIDGGGETPQQMFSARGMSLPPAAMGGMSGGIGLPPGVSGMMHQDLPGGTTKASPLAKRIARPQGPPPKA